MRILMVIIRVILNGYIAFGATQALLIGVHYMSMDSPELASEFLLQVVLYIACGVFIWRFLRGRDEA